MDKQTKVKLCECGKPAEYAILYPFGGGRVRPGHYCEECFDKEVSGRGKKQ